MAKVKLTFTEDQIKLIRNFRINDLNHRFYVTTTSPDQEAVKVTANKYNITAESDMGTKIISQINIHTDSEFDNEMVGIDTTNRWGGTFIFEDMALQLGLMDKIVPGTEENPLGPQFEEETQKYLLETANFIAIGLAMTVLLTKECSDEYRWSIRVAESRYWIVRHVYLVLMIAYIILFGVLGGDQFIYFQF